MPTYPSIIRQVRLVLEHAQDAPSLSELVTLIDDFVLECSAFDESEVPIARFEEELQTIHGEVVDCSSLHQMEVLLAVLYHLGPALPSISVISWFDVVLRPALREPKLPIAAVNHAKELIISTFQKTQNIYAEKVGEFRRRLFELYLLDAYNESSGVDILEWADLDEEQREKRTRWKLNLEDILLKYGNQRSEDFMTEINIHFATPTTRFQLLGLLNLYTSGQAFPKAAPFLAKHPLMSRLMYSLFLDNSSLVCTAGLTLIVKLLPFFAVHARDALKSMFPNLLAIFCRLCCWKERPPVTPKETDEEIDPEFEKELTMETNKTLHVRSNLQWQCLEMTFNTTISLPPSARPLFTALYYLYPSNVLKFLRDPFQYLIDSGVQSPYVESWEKAFNTVEIRRKSENLLREHVCHPLIIWRDSITELSEPEFWTRYDTSRIVSEMVMLDVRNHIIGLRDRYASFGLPEEDTEGVKITPTPTQDENSATLPPHLLQALDTTPSGKLVISMQEMIKISVALKSSSEVEILPASQWPSAPFPTPSPSPEKESVTLSSVDEDDNSSRVTQAIAGLQRDLVLLRNELNFEHWLTRENVKHIGRLYQDRIVMKTAEAERQALYNKLRKYRAQVISLEGQLREHKQQASSNKNKYADWNTELQKKLKELREEKKSWFTEAAALRSAEKNVRALFDAQGLLLADATKKVFELETQKKENQHKVDRLRDYERQIEQHIKLQRLWDKDFAKFNERGDQINEMQLQHKQMQLRLESYEQTQAEMDESARAYRRQIQALEARLAIMRHQKNTQNLPPPQEMAAFAAEKASLYGANKKLKEENLELRDMIDEMQAMVEILKGESIGRKGLISEQKAMELSTAS